MSILTIIYSNDVENLFKFKDKATHWLPEYFIKSSNNLYKPPNVICTTKDATLEMIMTSIQAGTINYLKVVWIRAGNPDIAYTFNKKGYVNNFFRI